MKKTKPKSGKTTKSTSKSSPAKATKKELESGIAERFLDVVANLGHDAERIAKDIKKMSKEIAKKLSEKIKSSKSAEKGQSKKTGKAQKEIAKREVKGAKKEATKVPSRAEKVVAKVVAKPAAKPVAKTAAKPAVTRTAKTTTAGIAPKTRGRKPNTATKPAAVAAKDGAPVQRRTRKPSAPKPVNVAENVEKNENSSSENQPAAENSETKPEQS
ncbi:MAG: hypothetical protein H7Y07_01130 [Pyrinomonadaceae bacterium]|nr:hypothetical protein [Sphingobacteriaceae bacterium]